MAQKILFALLAIFISVGAAAAQCTSYPNILQNGQNADANQVMANFDYVLNCANTNINVTIDNTNRRNILLNSALLAKLSGGYIRNLNVFADGYKASDGVNAGSSANYSIDTVAGQVSPTFTTPDQTPTMTSSTAPSGLVSAFSNGAAPSADWKAFDKNPLTGWSSTAFPTVAAPQWLQYQFSTQTAVKSYSIVAFTTGASMPVTSAATRAPKDWTLQGSNDGTSWVIIDTQTAQSAWTSGEVRSYQLASTANFSHYRVNITANNTTSGAVHVLELTLNSPPLFNNMTLVTTMQTADATVSNNRVLLEYNPASSVTLNTDLTVEVTCDNGTTWTAGALSAAGTAQAGRSVAETVDTVCGTTGNSFAARIRTLNAKNVQIYKTAVAVHAP